MMDRSELHRSCTEDWLQRTPTSRDLSCDIKAVRSKKHTALDDDLQLILSFSASAWGYSAGAVDMVPEACFPPFQPCER